MLAGPSAFSLAFGVAAFFLACFALGYAAGELVWGSARRSLRATRFAVSVVLLGFTAWALCYVGVLQ